MPVCGPVFRRPRAPHGKAIRINSHLAQNLLEDKMYPLAFESGGEDQDRLDVRSLEEVAHLPSRIERDRFFLLDRDDFRGFDACYPDHRTCAISCVTRFGFSEFRAEVLTGDQHLFAKP